MSGITSVSGYNSSLLSLLAQAEGGLGDPTLVDSLIASGSQAATQDTGTTSAATGSSSDLQDQIQAAVLAALETAEQSGNSDLKGTIYNTLVGVLRNNGIDPKTFKPTGNTDQSGNPAGTSDSQQQPVDPTTSNVLAQVLAALSGAAASSNPLAQLTSSQDSSQGSSDLLSLLSASRDSDPVSGDSLSQFLTLENDNQGSADALLSVSQNSSQNSGDLLSQFLSSQNNDQDLLGFLFDSGQ
jgi:hypothetical protein